MKIKIFALVVCLSLAISCTTPLANTQQPKQTVQKSDHPPQEKVILKVLAKSTHSWDGTPLIPYPQGQPQITILRISIPAGTTLPLHIHPVINAGVLIKGELTVVTKTGKTLQMKAGDPIVEVVNTWHYGKNPGSEPAEIIVFYAGTQNSPITLKQ